MAITHIWYPTTYADANAYDRYVNKRSGTAKDILDEVIPENTGSESEGIPTF